MTKVDRLEGEFAWLDELADKYGIDPNRKVELYCEVARHFQTKREQAKTVRELRQREKLNAILDAALRPEVTQ